MKQTIEQYKQKLKGQPREIKLQIIEQELVNRGLARTSLLGGTPIFKNKQIEYSPTDEQLKALKSEIESNVEAYESDTERSELIPFMYDRDLNWYFNVESIPNYELVIETVGYIENERKGLFDTKDFLNLLYWHYIELQKQFSRPFDYISHIRTIPLSDQERHVLIAMVLKWYGGIPFHNSSTDKWRVIKRMLADEFLKQFDGEETPEKKHVQRGIKYLMFPIKYEYWDIENKVELTKEEVAKQKNESSLEKVKEIIKVVEPTYKLSNKTGARADLIRVLNALHEMKLFCFQNGESPTKEQFMKQVGSFFGVDLSKYDADLSQCLNNVSLEANLKVFEKMKEITTKSHYLGRE